MSEAPKAIEAGNAQGVFSVDRAGRVVYVDARAAEILGYAVEEIQGRHFTEFHSAEGVPQAQANFARRQQGVGGVIEYRLRRKDGSLSWVAVASVPTHDADGAFLGITGFLLDIDESRRQHEMSAHERRLLRQIAGNYPLTAVLEDLCQTLETVSCRPLQAAVMLAEGNLLKLVAAPSLPPRFRAERAVVRLDEDISPCALAVHSQHEVVVGDTARANAAEVLAYGFGAVWSYPIIQDGETLGTLSLFLPAPGEPDAADKQVIEFVLQVARLALAHERQARELQDSEQRFRDYAGLSADWYWEQDANFRYIHMSGGAFSRGGFRVADSMGRTRWELAIESVSAAQWIEHRALLERHEVFQDFVYAIRVADGTRRWYSVSGTPVFAADGEFFGYRGTGRDITEQKRFEAALQASEQRFRDFAEMSADWYWEQDAEFRFTEVRSGADSRPAIPPYYDQGSIGYHRWDLPYVDVPEGFWEEHRRLMQAGLPFSNLHLRRRDDDGRVRHVEISGRALLDDSGRVVGYRGTGRDITEQMTSREKLEKNQHWLEQAVRAGGIGLWERDIESWAFSFRDNWRALFGYAEDEIRDTAEDFDRLVHPDDLARILAAGRAYTKNPEREYETRFRIRHKDGSWRWVLSRGKVKNEPVTGRRTFVGCHLDITEQTRAAELLRVSEQRFRDYAAMAADWFWELDAEFRYTAMYSGHAGEFFAVSTPPAHEAIGKRPWERFNVDMPDDFWEAHRRLLAAHQPFADLQIKARAADGGVSYSLVSGKPVFDEAGLFTGYRGTGRDISEQVASREKLEKTQRWLEQAIRAGGIGLWERDVDTWAFGFTDNWESLFGYAEGEVGSRAEDFDRIVHPDDLARIHAISRAYAQNPRGDYENRFRIRHKDGSWRWVLSRGNVLTDAASGRRTWIGSHIDITDQVQVEQRISDLAAMLETRVKARTAALQEANRELDAFNFSVSHDLRTPLRAIAGFSQALLEDCHERLDETGRDYLRRICNSTTRMGELIDALYDLARLSRAPLRLGAVDLSALAGELLAELRGQDERRVVEIEIAATPPAEGDPRLLRIVLANLLGNAWKFTGKTTPARIAFGARRDEDGRTVYSVSDNGAGFDMQFADKLFHMFHRLHREDEFPGQGVGLTTAQRIVARHGGRVWGESARRGAGASFHFTLWTDPALLVEAHEALENA